MQRFSCPACGARAYFHNLTCVCGEELFFDPERGEMVNTGQGCANRPEIGCNWLASAGGALCRSCAMSRVVPDLSTGDNRLMLMSAENAKRWVLANLANWGWFTRADTGRQPHFLMLSEQVGGRSEQIIMGHANGEITINVTEADTLIRLQRQRDMGEQYRSMVGHFRHELAHFCFDRLAMSGQFVEGFRALFGDEREDYAEALERHYQSPGDPGTDYITAYATAHPHEDWAETLAHLLHIVDFTDSFVSAGLSMERMPDDFTPYVETNTARLLSIASEVAIAINDINRALDNSDLYPFVLTEPVREKLSFAHGWMREFITPAQQASWSGQVAS